MESERNLEVEYTVYDYSFIPATTIEEGSVSVGSEEEVDEVASEIMREIKATHSNRGYKYGMSVVLVELTSKRYISGLRRKLLEVYADTI